MEALLAFVYARLSEPSTWRGIVALLSSAGIALDPGHLDVIVTFGLALIGLIGAFTADERRHG